MVYFCTLIFNTRQSLSLSESCKVYSVVQPGRYCQKLSMVSLLTRAVIHRTPPPRLAPLFVCLFIDYVVIFLLFLLYLLIIWTHFVTTLLQRLGHNYDYLI